VQKDLRAKVAIEESVLTQSPKPSRRNPTLLLSGVWLYFSRLGPY